MNTHALAADAAVNFSLRPTQGCDLIELAQLEAEADRFRARLIELELAFFKRVAQGVFADHPGLDEITVDAGDDNVGALQFFLEGDLEPAEYRAISSKLECALGQDAILAAVGTWTREGGPGTPAGSIINTVA